MKDQDKQEQKITSAGEVELTEEELDQVAGGAFDGKGNDLIVEKYAVKKNNEFNKDSMSEKVIDYQSGHDFKITKK